MRKPVVDYRAFRLSRIHEVQYRHLKLLLGWAVYFLLYFLTENLIPPDRCVSVRTGLDDRIPFCEWFVIPYVFWYGLILGSLVWFALYDIRGFQRLQLFFIITQLTATAIYILFPSRQDLRPAHFPRENILTRLVGFLYGLDTNTGVCPSLHVAFSLGLAWVWGTQKEVSRLWKGFVFLSAGLICLSTMFIKQHSALDLLAALPMCFFAAVTAERLEKNPLRG